MRKNVQMLLFHLSTHFYQGGAGLDSVPRDGFKCQTLSLIKGLSNILNTDTKINSSASMPPPPTISYDITMHQI